MDCPRCHGPTYVTASRAKGAAVRRHRQCGVRGDDEAGCGLRFASIETPIGYEVQVTVKMTDKGFKTIITPQRLEISDE